MALCNNLWMDLSSPMSSLIPSIDAVALEVLASTQSALGASRIHRLGRRGSRQGIANALDRLVEHGLVAAEPTNHGAMYRLNRDHLLAPAVLLAADARQTLIQRLAEACRRLSPAPTSASLFGSVARRDSTSRSDIDMLLIVDDNSLLDLDNWIEQLHDLSEQVEAWTGNRLEAITHSIGHLDELARAGEPIINSWRNEAVTFFGTDIRTILGHEYNESAEQQL